MASCFFLKKIKTNSFFSGGNISLSMTSAKQSKNGVFSFKTANVNKVSDKDSVT